MDRRRRGPRLGGRQRNNAPFYDPDSGVPYSVSARFGPDEAIKVVAAADALEVSVAEVVRRAIRYMPVDDAGRPLWPSEEPSAEQLDMLTSQEETQSAA